MTSTVAHVIFQACHAFVSLSPTMSLLLVEIKTDVVVKFVTKSQLIFESLPGTGNG
ncbi:MAG: hypothetical protein KF682_07915 [Nitrospira sp.]|nr:hypothetical protein [Nitrospira sp.]